MKILPEVGRDTFYLLLNFGGHPLLWNFKDSIQPQIQNCCDLQLVSAARVAVGSL